MFSFVLLAQAAGRAAKLILERFLLARNAGSIARGLSRNPSCVRLPACIHKGRAQSVQTDVQSSHAYLNRNANYSDD